VRFCDELSAKTAQNRLKNGQEKPTDNQRRFASKNEGFFCKKNEKCNM